MGVKTARMAEKGEKVVHIIIKLPQSSLRDASPLWDGAFGIVVQFPAKVQSLRARQRLPPRGSWQNRQVLTEGVSRAPSQALPRQLPRRGSQAVNLDAEVLGTKRKLPAVLLPLPLGEVASPTGLDGEGARRQPYFKVSSVMRNFPATPKAPPERTDFPRPGENVTAGDKRGNLARRQA